jgi:hypothetical protein
MAPRTKQKNPNGAPKKTVDPVAVGKSLIAETGISEQEFSQALADDMNVRQAPTPVGMGIEGRKAMEEVGLALPENETPPPAPQDDPGPGEQPGTTEGDPAPEEGSEAWLRSKVGEFANELASMKAENDKLRLEIAGGEGEARTPENEASDKEKVLHYLFGDAWENESAYGEPLKDQPLFQFLGDVMTRQTALNTNMVAGLSEQITEKASLAASGLDDTKVKEITSDPEFSYIKGLTGDSRTQALKMALKIKGGDAGEAAPNRPSSDEPKKRLFNAPFVESHSDAAGQSRGRTGGILPEKAEFDKALKSGDVTKARELAQEMMRKTGVTLY